MAWTTPKTDWKITYVDGEYAGDYFNYTDYNRIKGNIEYLVALPMPRVFIDDMGGDKAVGDPIYSSEFNAFQNNLEKIGRAVGILYENYPAFAVNGPTPTYADLNQIESFCVRLYNALETSLRYAVDSNNEYAIDTHGQRAVAEGE